MEKFIDVNKVIDLVIRDFPGNRKLQKELTIEVGETPYQSLSEVPWEDQKLLSITRMMSRDLLSLDSDPNIEQIKVMEARFLELSNRILMMELILKSEYCPPGIDDLKLLRIYIDIALPGSWNELQQHLEKSNEYFRKKFPELAQILKSLGF